MLEKMLNDFDFLEKTFFSTGEWECKMRGYSDAASKIPKAHCSDYCNLLHYAIALDKDLIVDLILSNNSHFHSKAML